MSTFVRVLAGLFVLAHGLVHLLYLTPQPGDPRYPFTQRESWLIPAAGRGPIGQALIAATVVGFALLAMAVWGVPGLSSAWPAIAIAASGLSLALMAVYWSTQLMGGVVIDVVVIALAALQPSWLQRFLY